MQKSKKGSKKEAEAQKNGKRLKETIYSFEVSSIPENIAWGIEIRKSGAFTCYYWKWIRYHAWCEIFLLGFSKDYWKEQFAPL